MTAERSDRRPVRIRRRGRHTTPSQVERVAQQAGKAAPAVAIAGALVAAPQASHALAASASPVTATAQSHSAVATGSVANTGAARTGTLDAVETKTVTVTAAKPVRHAATAQSKYYTVRSGDTLSKIAKRFYHNPGDWQYLYHENAKTVSNPDEINVGERLFIPATVPAHYRLTNYAPKHAKTTSTASQNSAGRGNGGTADVVKVTAQGTYSCSGLEQLWEQAGGNATDAFIAAEIAMAESGGNPNAISPTDDYGLWQINASNGALATLNPLQNARSAVTLSDNGANWAPWTTYQSGAYYGRC
jgi:LysM repeat protein